MRLLEELGDKGVIILLGIAYGSARGRRLRGQASDVISQTSTW
jgi:hypothetical protein